MRRSRAFQFAIVLALAPLASATAEVYRWTDEAGKLHFTSHLHEVPERYLAQEEGAAKAPAGNLNIVEGSGQGAAAPARASSPFREKAHEPAPDAEDVPDLRQRTANAEPDAAPKRRYETNCNSRRENCRRYQTQEFKDWKNGQLPESLNGETDETGETGD